MNPWLESVQNLIGANVCVILDRKQGDFGADVSITGELLHVTEDGEVSVKQSDGTIIYGWPALDIELIMAGS